MKKTSNTSLTNLGVASFLLLGAAAAISSQGCSKTESPPTDKLGTTREIDEELTTQGAQYLVPLRIVYYSVCTTAEDSAGNCEPCSVSPYNPVSGNRCHKFILPGYSSTADSYNLLQQRIEDANEIYKSAGVQFYLKGIESYNSLQFSNANTVYSSTSVQWQYVSFDLNYAMNLETNAWVPTYPFSRRDWLQAAASYYGDPSEVLIFIPYTGTGSAQGDFPAEGRAVFSPPRNLTDYRSVLAHELGHFFGLPHSFANSVAGCSGSSPPFCCDDTGAPFQPGSNILVDPYTNASITDYSYFWDLIYGKTSGGTLTYNFASSGVASAYLAANGPSSLRPKNYHYANLMICQGYGGETNCSINGARTQMTCAIDGSNYSDPSAMLNGLSNPSVDGTKVTGNLMSYGNGASDARPNVKLSASQIAHIRRALRYDITNTRRGGADLPTGGTYNGQVAHGGRPLLGRQIRRSLSTDLDFDGDGKRDLAVWEPPTDTNTSPVTYGTFRIHLAKDFTSGFNKEYTVAFGRFGDVPVLADYDGDGVTDLAVVTKSDRNNPITDNDVSWRVRYCKFVAAHFSGVYPSWVFVPDSLTCPTPTSGTIVDTAQDISHIGNTSDIFFPDLELDGNPSTKELAIFRPKESQYYWCTLPSGCASSTYSGHQKVVGTAGDATVPLPGLYDSDAFTDLAVYDQQTGTFTIQRSTGTPMYTSTPLTRAFGSSPHVASASGTAAARSGSIPVPHMVKSNRLALALWNQDSGGWYINWNPITSSTVSSACYLGIRGDIPLGGIDRGDGDNYSDMAVFRPGVFGTATPLFDLRYSTSGSCTGTSYSRIAGTSSSMVYVTSDFSGDGRPDIWVIDPKTMTWSGYISDDDFTNPHYNTTLTNVGTDSAVPLLHHYEKGHSS